MSECHIFSVSTTVSKFIDVGQLLQVHVQGEERQKQTYAQKNAFTSEAKTSETLEKWD